MNKVIYDEESLVAEEERPAYSNIHYLGWLAALLAGTALIGFVLSVVVFVFVFLRLKARASYLSCAVGAMAVLIILGVLSSILVLEFQQGFLQNYVPLPWPFL